MTFSSASSSRWIGVLFVLAAAVLLVAGSINLDAQRRGGGGGRGRVNAGVARTSVRSDSMVNRNVNVNRDFDRNVNTNIDRNVNRNVNRNIDVNRDIDFDRDIDVDADYDRWGHPVARGVAAGIAAGIAVGTRVAVLPAGCTTVVVDGIAYSECGSTWYQPYYSGTTVQYVVVNDPH